MNPTTLTRPCCDVESTSLTYMYWTHGGTGMISSSSAFRLYPKKGHWDLFRLLHAVMHRTETLVYSIHPRENVAIIFGWIVSVIRWLLHSTVVPMPVQCHYSAGTDVGRGSLETTCIIWASEGKHSQKPTMPYHPTLMSSSVQHSSHQWTAFFLSYYNEYRKVT